MDLLTFRQFYQEQIKSLTTENDLLRLQNAATNAAIEGMRKDLAIANERCKSLEQSLLKAAEKFLDDAPSAPKTSKRGGTKYRSGEKVNHTVDGSAVYFIYCQPANAVKVGVSVDVKSRFSSLQTGNPYKLKLLGCIPGSYPEEQEIHRFFSDEWTGVSEWFYYDQDWVLYSYINYVIAEQRYVEPTTWFCNLDQDEKDSVAKESFDRGRSAIKNGKRKHFKAAQLEAADVLLAQILSALPMPKKHKQFLLGGK